MRNALAEIKSTLDERIGRQAKACRIAEAIRKEGSWHWGGLCDVDCQSGMIANIAWSGPGPPAHPSSPITKKLTSRAIANRKPVNVSDVARNPDYLTALGSTRSEIIIPVMGKTNDAVIGTIDLESERVSAFDTGRRLCLRDARAC